MSRPRPARCWLDVTATIGDGNDPDLDFRTAVHLAIYAAQDLSDGPVAQTAHPPKELTEKLRRGVPASPEQVAELGRGRWPLPPEAFALDTLPHDVPITPVKLGTVAWTLSDGLLQLSRCVPRGAATFVHEVEVTAGALPVVRHRISHVGGHPPGSPGVPRSLKLLSAVCGVYDGATRLSPVPTIVDDEDSVERAVAVIEDPGRRQPLTMVAAAPGEADEEWLPEVEACAREAFGLQHVVGITDRGRSLLNDVLGEHGILAGAIKTYRSGFNRLDIPITHPLTAWRTVQEHPQGRPGMLKRWRNRLMTSDALDRWHEHAT